MESKLDKVLTSIANRKAPEMGYDATSLLSSENKYVVGRKVMHRIPNPANLKVGALPTRHASKYMKKDSDKVIIDVCIGAGKGAIIAILIMLIHYLLK